MLKYWATTLFLFLTLTQDFQGRSHFKKYAKTSTLYIPRSHQEIMLSCPSKRTSGRCWDLFGFKSPPAVITVEMGPSDLCFADFKLAWRYWVFWKQKHFLILNCMEKIWPCLILRLLPSLECKRAP